MIRLLLSLLLGLTPLPAQEFCFGRCQLADGKPWVGARVTLFSQAIPGVEGLRQEFRQVVASDAQGRFRAQVEPGFVYTAWAAGEDPKGRQLGSKLAEGVVAGRPVLLRASGRPRPPLRRTVRGAAAWAKRGGLRYSCHILGHNRLVLPLPAPVDGELKFPALPEAELRLHVRSADGLPLFGDHTGYLSASSRRRTIYLPPPTPVWVEVRDWAGEKPLAGASVYFLRRGQKQLLGVTDARGRAAIDRSLQHYRDPQTGKSRGVHDLDWHLLVEKPGYQAAPCHWFRYLKKIDAVRAAHAAGEALLRSRMRRGRSAQAQLLLAPGIPAGHTQILVTTVTRTARGRPDLKASTGGRRQLLVETDAEGRFELHGLPVASHRPAGQLIVSLTPAQRASVSGAVKGHLLPRLRLSLPAVLQPAPVWALNQLPQLSLRVRAADGAPALGARVVIRQDHEAEPRNLSVACDQGGWLRLLVEPGSRLLLGVEDRTGYACASLQIAARPPQRLQVPLQIQEPITVSGVVRGPEGEGRYALAIQGRVVDVKAPRDGQPAGRYPSWRGKGAALGPVVRADQLEFLLERAHYDARSDAKGEFAVRLPAERALFSFEAGARVAGKFRRGRAVIELRPGIPARAEIELGKR